MRIAKRLSGIRPLAALSGFMRDGRGSISVEAVLVLPIVIWAYVAGFVFYDAFRTENTNTKAAYVVADMLSRQMETITPAYLDGLGEVYEYLAQSRHPTRLRVTHVGWDTDAARYRIRWSYGTGSAEPLTDAGLDAISDRLPDLVDGETLIVVQTVLDYTPPVAIGLQPRRMENFIPTRPRYAANLGFSGTGS